MERIVTDKFWGIPQFLTETAICLKVTTSIFSTDENDDR